MWSPVVLFGPQLKEHPLRLDVKIRQIRYAEKGILLRGTKVLRALTLLF